MSKINAPQHGSRNLQPSSSPCLAMFLSPIEAIPDMTMLADSGTRSTMIPVAREHAVLMGRGAEGYVFEAERGVFAVECTIEDGKRRVLDFLLPGEVLPGRMLDGFGDIRIRAIEPGVLRRQTRANWLQITPAESVAGQTERGAQRAFIAAAIAGIVDVDARVASYLVALGLRTRGDRADPTGYEIPIPRDDVADFILINPDTLSRAYSRLRKAGVMTRSTRNRPVIQDWRQLTALSPLARIIEDALR